MIYTWIPNEKIVRTFEMENGPFEVRLEFLEFEALSTATSKLLMHVLYSSTVLRDQHLKMPFAYEINSSP